MRCINVCMSPTAWCQEKPIAVASSARWVTRTLHTGPNPQRAVTPFTGSTSHSPLSSDVERIASHSVRSDDTVVKGTPCPSHRIRILLPSRAIRPAKIGIFVRACANAPVSALASRRRLKKKTTWTAKFATMASPTLHRISNRPACEGLISWVDTVAYFRRFTVTRPPSFGVWAIPRKCDFSSAAASVWIRESVATQFAARRPSRQSRNLRRCIDVLRHRTPAMPAPRVWCRGVDTDRTVQALGRSPDSREDRRCARAPCGRAESATRRGRSSPP